MEDPADIAGYKKDIRSEFFQNIQKSKEELPDDSLPLPMWFIQ